MTMSVRHDRGSVAPPAARQGVRRADPPGRTAALGIQRRRSPYEALMRAIAHQQLHGRAALAILARFEALYPADSFPAPELVLASPEAELRACGFSGAKIAAMRAICAAALDGTVPTRRGSARLSDEALIERLTSIRGVGRWTVEMLLIFTLGRPDVLPVDDFRRARWLSGAVRAGRGSRSRRRWPRSGWPGRRTVRSRPGICGAHQMRENAPSSRRRGREPVSSWQVRQASASARAFPLPVVTARSIRLGCG